MIDAVQKKVNYIIEACESFKEESAYHVINTDGFLKDSKALLSYNVNDFKVQIISSSHPTKEDFDEPFNVLKGQLELRKNGRSIVVKVEDIKSLTHSLGDPFIVTYYTRSIVIDEEELINQLHHTALLQIDEMPDFTAFPIKAVKIGSITHFKYFSIVINEVFYECFCHENKDLKKVYLFIESREKTLIEEFKKCVDVILQSIALFNGDWYRDDLFIYSKDINDEEYKSYRSFQFHFIGKSIIAKYKICDSIRCCDYLKFIGHEQNSKKLCARMDNEMLSTIAHKIYKDQKIKRIIELLIEGTNTKSDVLKASVYSVAIETLTNIVYSENEDVLNPIRDKKVAEEISAKLLDVVEEYRTVIPDDALDVYKKKISHLNKPINIDRLSKSFKILGIKLNEHDEKTLAARNKFLHGSTPFKNFEIDKEQEKELKLLTTKLRMLICMLLLKYLGYKGHLYNIYGHTKSFEAKSIIEHLVRIV